MRSRLHPSLSALVQVALMMVQDIAHIHVVRPWLIPVGDLLLLGMLAYL